MIIYIILGTGAVFVYFDFNFIHYFIDTLLIHYWSLGSTTNIHALRSAHLRHEHSVHAPSTQLLHSGFYINFNVGYLFRVCVVW